MKYYLYFTVQVVADNLECQLKSKGKLPGLFTDKEATRELWITNQFRNSIATKYCNELDKLILSMEIGLDSVGEQVEYFRGENLIKMSFFN